jgi:hypothetical protein
MTAVDNYAHGPFEIVIHHDPDAGNPYREHDTASTLLADNSHIGTMANAEDHGIVAYRRCGACDWHKVYRDGMSEYVDNAAAAAIVATHTRGIAVAFSTSEAEYIAYMDRDTIRHEVSQYNRATPRDTLPPIVTRSDRALALALIMQEIATFRAWAEGETYGYEILHDGRHVDSCWGYYGWDDVTSAAEQMADDYATQPEYQPDAEEPYSPLEDTHDAA